MTTRRTPTRRRRADDPRCLRADGVVQHERTDEHAVRRHVDARGALQADAPPHVAGPRRQRRRRHSRTRPSPRGPWCHRPGRRCPAPGTSAAASGSVSVTPRSRAPPTIDAASTCGETCSREAARARTSSGVRSGADTTSARRGRPAVSVPVLSKSMTRARASVSSAPPPLTMMPRLAERLMPETMAMGAASRSGHGVATTRTARARTGSPERSQATTAMISVSGHEEDGVAIRHAHERAPWRSAPPRRGARCRHRCCAPPWRWPRDRRAPRR